MSMIEYEVDGAVAVISLNRPEKANAQSPTFLRELNDRWEAAAADDDVRVIVLRANGRHFSSGHDFSSPDEIPQFEEGKGIRSQYLFEEEVFYGFDNKDNRKTPPKETDAFLKELAVAKTADAPKWAVYEYTSAELYLHEAKARLGYSGSYYQVAYEYAQKATDFAKQAKEKAQNHPKE